MFAPKWKKEAKHLVKGALKFLHYKRDLLDEDRIGEIESRREDLIEAIKQSDEDAVAEASKQLRATCENALPKEKPMGWFEENVEVMFVAIVIALGLRAYYLQPFRIPTGSMEPTLNGITGEPLKKDDWPSLVTRLKEKVLRGRKYVYIVNDRDREISTVTVSDSEGRVGVIPAIANTQRFFFFSRSVMQFKGSKPMWLPAPQTPCRSAGLNEALSKAQYNGWVIPKGEVLVEGFIDTGDLVLVNKFAYHFRKPKRGETFVFDTIGIRRIDQHSGDQSKGSHYIKRLCGVPGDVLQIDKPYLMVNGKIAKEPGIVRVMEGGEDFDENHMGYVLAGPIGSGPHRDLTSPDSKLTLRAKAAPGMREYAAFGDNTDNSLDSRYWGSVKEYNLVGPALFSLWPFTSGHWGFIE